MSEGQGPFAAAQVPPGYGILKKKKSLPAAILGIVLALSLVLFSLLQCLQWVAFDPAQYLPRYQQNNVESATGLDEASLMHVTHEMIRYLQDGRDDLVIEVTIDGEVRPVFEEREIQHMVDVKELFLLADAARVISLAVLLVALLICVFAAHAGHMRTVGRAMLWTFAALVGLAAIAAVIAAIDFEWFFTQFHLLFFTNDLWLLDPATSIMIRMLPEPFFMGIVAEIGWRFGLAMLGSVCIAVLMRVVPQRRYLV